jgi:non-homologous end joining protein Ku
MPRLSAARSRSWLSVRIVFSSRHALEAEGLLQILSKVAIRRLVLTSREHIIGLEPLGRGLMGTLLRYRTNAMRMRSNTSMRVQDVKATKDTRLRRYQTDRLWRSRIL